MYCNPTSLASGEGVGAKTRKKVTEEGYQLVVTGHSLGAGTAALLGLRLKEGFQVSLPCVCVQYRHVRVLY